MYSTPSPPPQIQTSKHVVQGGLGAFSHVLSAVRGFCWLRSDSGGFGALRTDSEHFRARQNRPGVILFCYISLKTTDFEQFQTIPSHSELQKYFRARSESLRAFRAVPRSAPRPPPIPPRCPNGHPKGGKAPKPTKLIEKQRTSSNNHEFIVLAPLGSSWLLLASFLGWQTVRATKKDTASN